MIGMKFVTIGYAWKKQGKKKPYITLKFSEKALREIYFSDLVGKVCLFRNLKKSQAAHPDYFLAGPMHDQFRKRYDRKRVIIDEK